jgi:heme-degrading monooxygenase HmoA
VIAVVSIVEIYRGRQEAWKQVWQQTSAVQRAAEGVRSVRLFHDTDQPERYVIFSEWEDRAHYDRFVRHAGISWLLDVWEYAPGTSTQMVVEEEE